MKVVCFILVLGVLIPFKLFGIADVSSSDGAYSAIKNSVNSGYLPLQQGGKFNPSLPITRKDAAIIIEKLLQDIKDSKVPLSESEVQDLKSLSRSFKLDLSSLDLRIGDVSKDLASQNEELKALHHDLTKLKEDLVLQEKILDEYRLEKEKNSNGSVAKIALPLGLAAVALLIGIAL